MLPLWSVYAFCGALLVTAIPLIQEKFKANTYALIFWLKVCMVLVISPWVLRQGLPTTIPFYVFTALTAVLYVVSDISYYRAVPIVGSGVITRILPASVVLTFFIWFAVDPELIGKYTSAPWKMVSILGIMFLFSFCATRLKKCAVSWQGIKMIWFVLLACCVGPILTKLALDDTTRDQGPGSYIFVQGIMTIIIMGVYCYIKQPLSKNEFLSKNSIRTGFIMSLPAVGNVFLKTSAVQLVDNPGFVSMILFTDALWVILIYKIIGRKEESNIWAGLGIVGCAALIVLIKSI